MSAPDNLSNLSNNSTDVYADELFTWLQYPVDDVFERNYCSDLSVGWQPPSNTEATTLLDTNPLGGSSSDVGTISTCTGSGSFRLPTKKKNVGTKSFLRSSSNAEDALALGAARAAGHSSQVGLDAFSKVRTSMQPQTISQITTPCSSSKAFDHKDRSSVEPNVPVPCASRLPQGGVHSPRLQVAKTFSLEKTQHAPPAAISFATEKSRKVQERHLQQLSHTQESRSSHNKEQDSVERICNKHASNSSKEPLLGNAKVKGAMMTSSSSWDVKGKVSWADRTSETPPSYSGGSQTSMSLSFTYNGKRKHGDSELQSEDADDNGMNSKVPRKSSSRRNRVSEVHNLSERNRRNRINDKLKALQELIPNSSKTDKASVLDEAIEYMKTLQIQLQMVSMRSSMHMSPMMMPMAFPQTPMHMAPQHSIGLGVPVGHAGMGIGMGMGMDMGFVQQSGRAAPFQSQYGMPFQSGNTASLHDNNQACTNPSEQMHARSLYTHQCPPPDRGQHLGYPSLNLEHEEQDGILD